MTQNAQLGQLDSNTSSKKKKKKYHGAMNAYLI